MIPGGDRAVRAASRSQDEARRAVGRRQGPAGGGFDRHDRDVDGNALNRAHRRKYLLSGLLECGVCGGGFTIIDAANYGCATHRSKGTCSNGLKLRRGELERRVLHGLRGRLLAPELVEEFARAFQEEVNRLAAEKTQYRAEDEGRLEAVRRKIATMIRAIEDGMYQPSMKARMEEVEAEKAMLENRLASAPEPPKIRLYPNLPGPGCTARKWRRSSRRSRTRRSRLRPPRSSAARSSGSR